MQVSPRALSQLKAVYGDCLPAGNALALLEASPAAPASDADLQALRAIVLENAGRKLAELGALPASTTVGRAQGAALQIAQVQARRELRTEDGLLKVLSEKKAAAVFADVAAMTDVPFGFLEEGCVHRSHVVAKRLEEAGVFTEKIFTIPERGDLVMNTPKAKLGYTVVWYHEAVCVHVQTMGGLERRVLDPSVADRPLRVDEWLATMHPSPVTPNGDLVPESERKGLETFVLPRFAYGLGARNDPPTAWDPKDLESALKWNDDWRAVAKDYEDGGYYDELPKLAGRAARTGG